MVNPNPFTLVIEDNKVGCSYITQKQLRYINSSNPNVVEADSTTVADEGTESETTYTAYIKITLDDANNPTTAEVEYHLKFYCPAYAANPGYSDTFIAVYEGTLNKVTSPSS